MYMYWWLLGESIVGRVGMNKEAYAKCICCGSVTTDEEGFDAGLWFSIRSSPVL